MSDQPISKDKIIEDIAWRLKRYPDEVLDCIIGLYIKDNPGKGVGCQIVKMHEWFNKRMR